MTRGTVECIRCGRSVPIEEAWQCWHTTPESWGEGEA
jgi:ribosomal protein S26